MIKPAFWSESEPGCVRFRTTKIAQLCRIPFPVGGKVMIFVPTRKTLQDQGLETPFYHSRLGSAWERERLIKRFVGEAAHLWIGLFVRVLLVWGSTFRTCD
jgi:hypothetical protein